MKFTLLATAPLGLESVVAREVRQLGYETTEVDNGRIIYEADDLGISRSNLWLRAADRVMMILGEFPATTFEELFEGTKALPWSELLPIDARFPVEGRSVKSQLSSVPACQAIVKKAIVANMQEKFHQEWFDETGALYSIEVSIHRDIATLAIDTSGSGLHKRGYRTLTGPAPIKETLAASLVMLSRWEPHRPFADFLCGTGTIAIEAALLALRIAPGSFRSFASEDFAFMDKKAYQEAREEVADLADYTRKTTILASDIDPAAVRMAQTHAVRAKVSEHIDFRVLPAAEFYSKEQYGCVVTNPPYGQRLGDDKEVRILYEQMRGIMKVMPTWSFFVLSAHPDFTRFFGKKADKNRKLYNGRIECHLYQYLGPLPPRHRESQDALT